MERASKAGSPLLRTLTVVLTNGASLRLPTILRRERPHFAALDIYKHNLWRHKIVTEASLEADQNFLPDFSKFYGKFKDTKGTPAAASAANTTSAAPAATAATAASAVPRAAGPGTAAKTQR